MFKRCARQWLAICCLTAITTACGGGGGGGSGGSNSSTAAPTTAQSSSPSPVPSPTPTPSPSVSHSVHITWTVPTTRADGSALAASELVGYRLFYTLDSSSPSQGMVIVINDGMTTSTDLSLNTGTYAFAITAIDSSGTESALSTPAFITLN